MGWKENVLTTHQLNQYPHWKIVRGTNSKANTMFGSMADDDFSKSHQRLMQCLDQIAVAGAHLVQFRSTLEKSADFNDYQFEVPLGGGVQQSAHIGNSGPMLGYVSHQQMQAEIQSAIATEKRLWDLDQSNKDAIKKLTETVKELKEAKKNESPFGELINHSAFAPVIAGLIGKFMPGAQALPQMTGPQIGISGIDANNVPADGKNNWPTSAKLANEAPEEALDETALLAQNQEKMKEVMNYLIELKGGPTQAINFLLRLKRILEKNPSYLGMIEPMLVSITDDQLPITN